ncbi:MAG TPA: hypothetical protein VHV32_16105 [Candidatus Angelobacter sp.]|jgi:hypothetical protein|nr:hypothetical protein [Candidatus Angelobacter sp.]
MTLGQVLTVFYSGSFGFSLLECFLGAVNAPIFKPSWEYLIVLVLVFWIISISDRFQRLFWYLVLLDFGCAIVVYYALGTTKLRLLHFAFAICWLLLGIFYLGTKKGAYGGDSQ